MPKSRAEIQREYRARKIAKEGDAYRRKENARVMEYYVPAEDLSDQSRKKRNAATMLRNRASRANKAAQRIVEAANNPVPSSSGYESNDSHLVVKLPFNNNRRDKGPKKANKRALARARKNIKELQDSVEKLEKKVKVKNTQLCRLKNNVKKLEGKNGAEECEKSPKKVTEELMDRLRLTPRRKSLARKKLLLGSVILAEINGARKTVKRKSRYPFQRLLSTKLVKKYRLQSTAAKYSGLGRNSLSKTNAIESVAKARQEIRSGVLTEYADRVRTFLQREDNARCLPGKKDQVKSVQKYILVDFMTNLHVKFLSENTGASFSFASFCRMRPENVRMCCCLNRESCLCSKHQNMAEKVEALRKVGPTNIGKNPDHLKMDLIQSAIDAIPDTVDSVKYKEWTRTKINERVKTVLMEKTDLLADFKVKLITEFNAFEEHVRLLKAQFASARSLKDQLPHGEIIVLMDFAENYVCRSNDEVQSAYWGQDSVTLHPVVVYFRTTDGQLEHQSYTVVSDELRHDAASVLTFIRTLMPEFKRLTALTKIHYYTDSPTSQYRNKYIFNFLKSHKAEYGVNARWNYWESGHGKSVCDGIGGTAKRMADTAVKLGKAVIQDARSFHHWAVNTNTKITSVFVPKSECESGREVLGQTSYTTVPGTMKLHSVEFDHSVSSIRTSITSCYCAVCLGAGFCDIWRTVDIPKWATVNTTVNPVKETATTIQHQAQDQDAVASSPLAQHQFRKDAWVMFMYEGELFPGKITDIKKDAAEISSMAKCKKSGWKWPEKADIEWYELDEIISEIAEPIKINNRGMFRVCELEAHWGH